MGIIISKNFKTVGPDDNPTNNPKPKYISKNKDITTETIAAKSNGFVTCLYETIKYGYLKMAITHVNTT